MRDARTDETDRDRRSRANRRPRPRQVRRQGDPPGPVDRLSRVSAATTRSGSIDACSRAIGPVFESVRAARLRPLNPCPPRRLVPHRNNQKRHVVSPTRFRSLSDPDSLREFAASCARASTSSRATAGFSTRIRRFSRCSASRRSPSSDAERVRPVRRSAQRAEEHPAARPRRVRARIRDHVHAPRRRDSAPCSTRCYLIRDPETGEEFIHGILIDITARKQLEAQLREMSTHDPLTGALNRRYLTEIEQRFDARSRRSSAAASSSTSTTSRSTTTCAATGRRRSAQAHGALPHALHARRGGRRPLRRRRVRRHSPRADARRRSSSPTGCAPRRSSARRFRSRSAGRRGSRANRCADPRPRRPRHDGGARHEASDRSAAAIRYSAGTVARRPRAMVIIATPARMIAAAATVRGVTDSPAIAQPRNTATSGFTYAYVDAFAGAHRLEQVDVRRESDERAERDEIHPADPRCERRSDAMWNCALVSPRANPTTSSPTLPPSICIAGRQRGRLGPRAVAVEHRAARPRQRRRHEHERADARRPPPPPVSDRGRRARAADEADDDAERRRARAAARRPDEPSR